MSKSQGRKIYKVHKWTGLIAGIFIFIMGLSGAVLVWHEDLEALEHRSHWQVENSQPVSIDKAYQTLTRQYPNWEIRLQRFSQDPGQTLIFSLRRPDARLMVFAHPANGSLLAVLDAEQTFSNWMLKLHYALHAGLPGEILVLVFGLVFLLSLITGVIVYRKAIGRMLLFRISFKRKNKRTWASSLHRFVGVWALLLNLAMVLSGLVIIYGIVSKGLATAKEAPAPIASPPVAFSIDGALKTLQQQYPAFAPTYMRFPKAAGQGLIVNGHMAGEPFYYSQYYNVATFEQATGALTGMKLNTAAEASTRLDSVVRAVHFVEYGNWFIKALFCLVGLSAPLLSITGFLLWRWQKKKTKVAVKVGGPAW